MVNMTELCEQHRGLVYSVAKRYTFSCLQDRAIDLDDLAQAGYVGLIEAAGTFDSSRGAFSSWAVVYILKEMRALLGLTRRDQRADHGAVSLDAPLAEDTDTAVGSQLPSGEDIEEAFDHRELMQAVRTAVNELPDGQRELVRLHDLEGGSLVTAGRSLGLSQAATRSAYSEAVKAMHRDVRLHSLAQAHHIDRLTDWHRHVGTTRYQSTWMSATEALVFWREELSQRLSQHGAQARDDDGRH